MKTVQAKHVRFDSPPWRWCKRANSSAFHAIPALPHATFRTHLIWFFRHMVFVSASSCQKSVSASQAGLGKKAATPFLLGVQVCSQKCIHPSEPPTATHEELRVIPRTRMWPFPRACCSLSSPSCTTIYWPWDPSQTPNLCTYGKRHLVAFHEPTHHSSDFGPMNLGLLLFF